MFFRPLVYSVLYKKYILVINPVTYQTFNVTSALIYLFIECNAEPQALCMLEYYSTADLHPSSYSFSHLCVWGAGVGTHMR